MGFETLYAIIEDVCDNKSIVVRRITLRDTEVGKRTVWSADNIVGSSEFEESLGEQIRTLVNRQKDEYRDWYLADVVFDLGILPTEIVSVSVFPATMRLILVANEMDEDGFVVVMPKGYL